MWTCDTCNVHVDPRKTNLLFEAEEDAVVQESTALDKAKNLLQEECLSREIDVRPESPERFMNLVNLMKKFNDLSSLKQLQAYAESKPQKERCVRMLYDAMQLVQTDLSIQFMVGKLIESSLPGKTQLYWMMSIFLLKSPTKRTLSALKPLITETSSYKPSQQMQLAVAAVVNEFCARGAGPGSENCLNTQEVADITNIYFRKLNTNCAYRTDSDRVSVCGHILSREDMLLMQFIYVLSRFVDWGAHPTSLSKNEECFVYNR